MVEKGENEIIRDALCEILNIVRHKRYWKDEQSVGFHRGYIVGLIERHVDCSEPDEEQKNETLLSD